MDETTMNPKPHPTLNLAVIPIQKPEEINLILGQAHFIKTIEDLHEALVTAVPGIRFGLAFCESSGPALVRWSGTDEALTALARTTMRALGTGHAFLILLRDAFPINVLPAVRAVPEVCGIYCASANPVQVIIAETEQGRGILGVIDGVHTQGIETDDDIAERKALLRRFGYKAP
jgi:adenosine/AMP kinase